MSSEVITSNDGFTFAIGGGLGAGRFIRSAIIAKKTMPTTAKKTTGFL